MANNMFIIKILSYSIFLIISVLTNSIETSIRADREMKKIEDKLESVISSLQKKDLITIYGNMLSLNKIVGFKRSDDDQKINNPLLRKIDEFLRSHRLQIRFPSDGSSADYFGRALGKKNFEFDLSVLTNEPPEPRTKLKRIILPLLLALKLKAIIILPIIVTLIGLIGIKGLGTGLLALLLSGAVALKVLLTPSPLYPARISFTKPYEHHDYWHRSQEELIKQLYHAWTPEFSHFDPQYTSYQDIP